MANDNRYMVGSSNSSVQDPVISKARVQVDWFNSFTVWLPLISDLSLLLPKLYLNSCYGFMNAN